MFIIKQNNKSNLVMKKEQTRFFLLKNSQFSYEHIKAPQIAQEHIYISTCNYQITHGKWMPSFILSVVGRPGTKFI